MSSLTDAVVGPDEGDAGTATAISSSPQGAGAKKHLDAWEQRKLTKVHEELVSLRQATNFLHPLPWRSEHRPAGVVDVDLTLLGQDLKHGDIETSAEFWEDLHLLVHNVQIFAEFELKARSILTQKEAEAAERINTVAAGGGEKCSFFRTVFLLNVNVMSTLLCTGTVFCT
ncbi:unnamed protein product [Amoebophrya sp. A25]|nr:unnamed protein product [Amoebophrya sp. A25]|eukprot:GSA25T00007672001.1